MTKDLVVLVADKDAREAFGVLLARIDSLGIRRITYDVFSHPSHDPAVYHGAHDFLREFIRHYSFCLVVLDHEGSGQEQNTAADVTETIKRRLQQNGWANRSEVIVLEPELEIWVWVDSVQTATSIGWQSYSDLKNWLANKGHWGMSSPKPRRPKEAFRKALAEKRIPLSSSIFREIGENANLQQCIDPSFQKLRSVLQGWFPERVQC